MTPVPQDRKLCESKSGSNICQRAHHVICGYRPSCLRGGCDRSRCSVSDQRDLTKLYFLSRASWTDGGIFCAGDYELNMESESSTSRQLSSKRQQVTGLVRDIHGSFWTEIWNRCTRCDFCAVSSKAAGWIPLKGFQDAFFFLIKCSSAALEEMLSGGRAQWPDDQAFSGFGSWQEQDVLGPASDVDVNNPLELLSSYVWT